jgi:hypothetical protein
MEQQTGELTFEKIWAASQETDRQMKETAERIKETDRQMKETDRRIGELGNRFGELAEHLVTPSIKEKFNALGFHFTQSSQNLELSDPESGRFLAEIDILLENGDVAIAVEVKSKLLHKDVDDHSRRMEVLRRTASRRRAGLKFRGAVAGAIMSKEVRAYALAAGFYVIEQSGDTVRINIPKGFRPREW